MPKRNIMPSVYEALIKEYLKKVILDPKMDKEEINLSTIKPTCNLYPETQKENTFFWRCDHRPPEELKKSNLSARETSGVTWQMGGEIDNLDGRTCVCLSKTIAGAIFFPCEFEHPSNTITYIYAIKLDRPYCDLDTMQRIVHRIINPNDEGVGNSYYPYDPLEEGRHGWISPRYLYGEVFTDEISWDEVVGCWRLERELLIENSHNTKPGVTLVEKQKAGKKTIKAWSEEASFQLDRWFKQLGLNEYYSYGGVIKLKPSTPRPRSETEAEAYYYENAAFAKDANQETCQLKPKLELVTRAPFSDDFEVKK